jgi:hypothetical protein
MTGYHAEPRRRNAELVARIEKLVPRLASTHDGEVVATARAINRTLKAAGLDWHDLAKAVATNFSGRISHASLQIEPDKATDWSDLARWCCDHDNRRLTPREREFVEDMVAWCRWREPTRRQAVWLADIANRLLEARSP